MQIMRQSTGTDTERCHDIDLIKKGSCTKKKKGSCKVESIISNLKIKWVNHGNSLYLIVYHFIWFSIYICVCVYVYMYTHVHIHGHIAYKYVYI